MPVDVERRRFTADEYQRMGEAGILSRADRVELIEGEIIAMSPIGTRHCAAVDRATRVMVTRAGTHAIVRVQGSVRLNMFTEPEPDIVLLRPRDDFYASAHPGPAEILLIVEVAETSLRFDRDFKGPLYARTGIAEYWLVDLDQRVVTCCASPQNGAYRQVSTHARGETPSPGLLPACVVAVDDLLAD